MRLGKKQELRREFQFFSMTGYALILGARAISPWCELTRPSLADQLIKRADGTLVELQPMLGAGGS